MEVFHALYKEAVNVLPKEYADLGDLIAIDGSLIDATLSMNWADYRDGAKKAKAHLGFDINYGISSKIFLTDAKKMNVHSFLRSFHRDRPAFWIDTTSVMLTLTNGRKMAYILSAALNQRPPEH